MSANSREAILAAAKRLAQAHGYGGMNYRDLAADAGIKPASIYHHFPSKADLATALARRYWQDTAAELAAMRENLDDPVACFREYPKIFRRSLESGNRLCLCSFMAAEYDDLPDAVKTEVHAFADVNIAWLSDVLVAAKVVTRKEAKSRASSIFAAIAGAQLMARSRSDLTLFDALIENYRSAQFLPG